MGVALAAVGSAVAGWVGVTGLSVTMSAVIGGAIIGAAIGGLTAALTDGDIGKGMLFGAIGGAVVGGVAGMAAGTGGAVATAGESLAGSTTSAYGAAGDVWMADMGATAVGSGAGAEGIVGAGVVEGVGAGTSAGVLDSIGMQVGVGALGTGAKAWLASSGTEDAAKAKSEENAAYIAAQLEMSKQKGEQAMEQLRYTRESASAAEQMAMDARLSELDQRKNEFEQTLGFQREQYNATQGTKAERQALFAGNTRRGEGATDTTQTEGVYDILQNKPQAALTTPTAASQLEEQLA